MRCWSSVTAKIKSSEYARDLSGRDSSIYTERLKKDFGQYGSLRMAAIILSLDTIIILQKIH
jgi:hypothetical protein